MGEMVHAPDDRYCRAGVCLSWVCLKTLNTGPTMARPASFQIADPSRRVWHGERDAKAGARSIPGLDQGRGRSFLALLPAGLGIRCETPPECSGSACTEHCCCVLGCFRPDVPGSAASRQFQIPRLAAVAGGALANPVGGRKPSHGSCLAVCPAVEPELVSHTPHDSKSNLAAELQDQALSPLV